MKYRSIALPTWLAVALMIGPLALDIAFPAMAETEGTPMYVYNGIGVVQLFVVMFWIFSVVSNAQSFGRKGMLFTRWTAIGWFLVPFANFYMPYRGIAEAWRASDPAFRTDDDQWRRAPGPRDLLLWWISIWLSIITFSKDPIVHWVGIAISVVGIVCFIRGALALTKRQEQIARGDESPRKRAGGAGSTSAAAPS